MSRTIRLAVMALGVFAVTSVGAQEGPGAPDAPEPATDAPDAETGPPLSRSVSVGMTNNGQIMHSVELEDSPTLRVKRGSEDSRWGTAELVSLVVEAAEAVAAAYPGSRLNVGDLSRQHGGRTRPHRSHRAGRDVDLGFYLVDGESGEAIQSDRFVNIGRSGRGSHHGRVLRFDVARNWALMRAILQSPTAAVQYVLVNPSLRRLLLRHAEATDADPALVSRFAELSASRSGSASHRSHFHVRIYCSAGDRPRCVDAPPFHAWVFTTDAQIDKATREYREYRPPRRARPRRRGQRARMRRRAAMMNSAMGGMSMRSAMSGMSMRSAMDGMSMRSAMDGMSMDSAMAP